MATQENKERRYQLIAALLTLLITVGTLTLLWFSTLRFQWPPEDGTRTVAQQDSILFGGEYVQLGDLDFPTDDDEMAAPGNPDDVDQPAEPAVQGDAPDDNGNEAEREKPKVTQEKPSPAKETKKEEPKPEKTGTAKKKDESKPEQKKKNDKATDNKKNDNSSNKNNNNNKAADNSRNAPNPAAGKFGNGSKGGTQGSKDGNSNTGAKTGVGSIGSGLVGYGPKNFPKPHGPESGTVIVRVRVKADGKVHSAEIAGGTIKNASQRQECLNKALASQFSVPTNKITEGVGTIVYRFP